MPQISMVYFHRRVPLTNSIAMNSALLHAVGDPTTRLSELDAAVSQGVISPIQVQFLRHRCSNPAYWTYARLGAQFTVTRDQALHRALLRTACGVFWEPEMTGGQDPYLSSLDLPKFRDAVLERAGALNGITRRDAMLLASDLLLQRRRIAAMVLKAARLEVPLDLLHVEPRGHRILSVQPESAPGIAVSCQRAGWPLPRSW
jgi:hypothetical protein